MMPQPKLSKLELRILEALWARGKASIRDIHGLFPEPRPAYTTIQTIVYRMEAKHTLRRVQKVGNADIFEPLVARDVTRNRVLDEILSFFGGKAAPMMARSFSRLAVRFFRWANSGSVTRSGRSSTSVTSRR